MHTFAIGNRRVVLFDMFQSSDGVIALDNIAVLALISFLTVLEGGLQDLYQPYPVAILTFMFFKHAVHLLFPLLKAHALAP